MPAVKAPHTKTWHSTAKAVLAAIKRRGIPFSQFIREIKEDGRYHLLSQNIKQGHPPMSNRDGMKRLVKVEKWLAEHGN